MNMAHQSIDTRTAQPLAMPWEALAKGGAHQLKLRAHEALFCEGDDADFVYEVVEGVVCSYRILVDGRRQVLAFAYPGDLVGLSPSAVHRFSCEAVGEAKVRSIAKSSLMRCAREQADIGHCLLEFATSELASMQDHQLLLGRKSAIEKLASFLLAMARRFAGDRGKSSRFNLPMTRSDIADYLGLTIETVSRNMTKLKNAGVIDLPQTNSVHVRDIDRLAVWAEADDAAVN